MQTENEIVKNAVVSREKLLQCGWLFSYSVGNLQCWVQAKDILFYHPKEQKIKSIQQIKRKEQHNEKTN